jgi:hypothetical protein
MTAAGATNEDVCQVAYGYGLFTGGAGLNGGSHKIGCLTLPMSSGSTDRQIQFMQDLHSTILCCTPSYAAYIGETLPDDYTQARFPDTRYISPDRMIDASTCALPECTWFIKDMLHSTTHDGHDEFYKVLFNSDLQLTVNDMSEYPQFMQNDVNNQTFTRVKPTLGNDVLDALSNASERTSFLNVMKLIVAFFESFWDFMMN